MRSLTIPDSVMTSELYSTTCMTATNQSASCCYLTGLGEPLYAGEWGGVLAWLHRPAEARRELIQLERGKRKKYIEHLQHAIAVNELLYIIYILTVH